jgi:predicted permease
MQTLLQDLRYTLRQLRRTPSFTVVAVVTLALAIGANTAIFSVIDSILLEPLPYPHQARLMEIQAGTNLYNYPKGWVREFQRRAHSFSAVSAYTLNTEYNIAGAGSSDRAYASSVSTNLFTTLGVQPALGRFYSPAEEVSGQDRVVVLSYSYWQQHFGSDPSILNHSILVDGVNRQVIGIAPRQVRFPDAETDFWLPVAFKAGDAFDPWAVFGFRALGRLRDGIEPARAQAELRTLHPQMLTLFPWRMPDDWAANVAVVPLLASVTGDSASRLYLLLGAVALVLLIACANVANLLLARAAARQREMALRTALGANSRRLIRQMLTESATLAVLSGGLGMVLAAVSLEALKRLLPADTPRLANISLHGDVLVFAAAISLVTGILCGLVPAWHAATSNLQGSLRLNETNVFGTARRFLASRVLVIGQIALAVIVIIAAGVMLRSLYHLAQTDPGFRTERSMTAQISLDRSACAQKGACAAFYRNLLDRARALPGVQAAALVNTLPISGSDPTYVFDAENHPRDPRQLAMEASTRTVSAGYFELMGIHLLRGRLLDANDASGTSRAIVVNEALASQLWPNQDPIGKHLIDVNAEPSPGILDPGKASVIVGVVAGTHHQGLDKSAGWETYLPLSPSLSPTTEPPVMNILVRSQFSTASVATNLRQLVAEMNPGVPVTRIQTLDEVVSASTAAPRSLSYLLLAFALLALGVGSIGVYSLIAYTVSWRTREIGLRLALGANRLQVATLVLRQSLVLTLTGSAIGVAGALITTWLMRRFLFETNPADPLTFTAVPALLALLSILAAWAPARRASKVEPMQALRSE